MSYLDVTFIAVYFVVGVGLELRARKYLKDRDKLYTFAPIVTPDFYKPEGQSARRLAARYWVVGGVIVLVILQFFVWR